MQDLSGKEVEGVETLASVAGILSVDGKRGYLDSQDWLATSRSQRVNETYHDDFMGSQISSIFVIIDSCIISFTENMK